LLAPEGVTDAAVLPDLVPMGQGVTGLCAARRHGMVVNDYAARPEALPQWMAMQVSRVMSQPLIVRDQLLGVITLSPRGANAPPSGDDDLVAMGRLAVQAAVAVRNATLYEDAERRRREAEALAQVAGAISGGLSTAEVGAKVADSLIRLFDSSLAGVGLIPP